MIDRDGRLTIYARLASPALLSRPSPVQQVKEAQLAAEGHRRRLSGESFGGEFGTMGGAETNNPSQDAADGATREIAKSIWTPSAE